MSSGSDWASTNWTPRNILVAVCLLLVVAGSNLFTGMALEDYRSSKQGFQTLKPIFDAPNSERQQEVPNADLHHPEEGGVRKDLEGDRRVPPSRQEGPGADVLDRARLNGKWSRHADGSWGFAPHMNVVRVPGIGGAWTVTPDAATWAPEN